MTNGLSDAGASSTPGDTRRVRRITVVFGTRPEAIKLAPVIEALRATTGFAVQVVSTGQHHELLRPVCEHFGISPDVDLGVMAPDQTVDQLTARVLTGLSRCLERDRPDYVVVHGDTTTTMAAALAAFYARIPVGHVEAGLRTEDLLAPFPEELNRRMVALMATHHFAPTSTAAANLEALGVTADRIVVTGNTVIDALLATRAQVERAVETQGLAAVLRAALPRPGTAAVDAFLDAVDQGRLAAGPWVLVTGHRRESFGTGIENICTAVEALAERAPDWRFVFPVHLNPHVDRVVRQRLSGCANVDLLPPLRYDGFVALLARCSFVLTDSGGLQEEAPALGKPVVVMRERTERPEALASGAAVLVGTEPERIVAATLEVMQGRGVSSAVASVYGDGHAARRIAAFLVQRL